MSYPPRTSSSPPNRNDALDRSHSSIPSTSSAAPRYQLQDITRARDYAYEGDPLTSDVSPQMGHGAQQRDGAFSDVPYSPTGRGGSLDLSDAYIDDNQNYGAMRAESTDAHSMSPLRHEAQATFPPAFPHPVGQPIHPGASVSMQKQASNTSTPEKRYGPNAEKSGYRSPRARSHDRAGSSGLGNWQGAGGNNSPYGPLGAQSAPGSGLASAASSNPNLLYAVSYVTSAASLCARGTSECCDESRLLTRPSVQQEGDFIPPPSNAFSRAVFAVYDSSFIVRWIIYIIPLMVLLWIPGIVGLTVRPDATVWTVPLVWWSAWLSVVWGGWWGAALGE